MRNEDEREVEDLRQAAVRMRLNVLAEFGPEHGAKVLAEMARQTEERAWVHAGLHPITSRIHATVAAVYREPVTPAP